MARVTAITGSEATAVAKKKQTADESAQTGKSYSFRASGPLADLIDFVSAGLEVDASNLIRMVLRENLHQYVERVRQLPGKKGD